MTKEKYYFEEEVFSRNYKFSFKEDKELIKGILKYKKVGRVLELGCGEGGNSLKLAELGFEVTCVDISKTSTKKIKEFAEKKGIKLNVVCDDLESYKIRENFDIILCMGVLHFLPEKKARNLIEQCKRKTNKNGLNVFDVLLEGDNSQEEDSEGYYFKSEELKQIYFNWEILDYEEGETGFLIARK